MSEVDSIAAQLLSDQVVQHTQMLGNIHSRLGSMSSTIERLEHELLGNGQPGRLHAMEDRAEKLEISVTEFRAKYTPILDASETTNKVFHGLSLVFKIALWPGALAVLGTVLWRVIHWMVA